MAFMFSVVSDVSVNNEASVATSLISRCGNAILGAHRG